MLRRLVDAIVTLVAQKALPGLPAAGAPAEHAGSSPAVARPIHEASFAGRLESMTEDDGSQSNPLVAGSLELLGLDDLRQAMGDRWLALGSRAVEMAEAELRLQLDETDFYRPYGDTSFLVCFSTLDQPAADLKARQIGARIKAKLAQQIPEVAVTLSVEHFVAAVDRKALRQGGDLPIADRLFGTLERMREEAKATARRFRTSLLRDFQILFAPVWHTSKHVVILNRCLLDMTSGCTTLGQFQALADPLQLSRTLAELDFSLLTKSLEVLHQMLRSGRGSAVLVPVTLRTIDDAASRQEYVRLLSLIPDSYRKFLIIEISGIPATASPERLGELITMLAPFTKGMVLEVALDEVRTAALLTQSPWALSVNLRGASSTDPQIANRLRKFTSLVASTQTQTFAHGANSIGLALAALEAGFNYLDGPAIHPTVREPKPLSPLNPLPAGSPPLRGAKRWVRTSASMADLSRRGD